MIRPVLEVAARIGRRSVRTVRPEPPHEPEPLPDEPFAPVYKGHVPLTTARNPYAGWARARTDPLVFGPPGATELQGAGITHGDGWPSSCPCGVTWRGEGGCWACEEPEPPKQPESWFTPASKPAPDDQDDEPELVQTTPQRWDRL